MKLPFALLAASLLSACGGTAGSSPYEATAQRISAAVTRRTVPLHRDRRRSWISPSVARAKTSLLFVSDPAAGDVYIYQLPKLKLGGTITGFAQPQGECSDDHGNVWITDANAQLIYEVSHHGRLENELTDATGYPDACAWDPGTGNLAVMNIFGVGSVGGTVLVYKNGTGTPTPYENSKQYFYNFGGYDGQGNLFFDGRGANGSFMLSELAKGANSAETIAVSGGSIYFPGMVEWDSARKELIVGDQGCGNSYGSCVYTLQVGQNGATIRGTIDLESSSGVPICDLVQGVQYNKQLAGSDYDFCGYGSSATYVWPYPAGGRPSVSNQSTDVTPVGAAVSR